MLEFYDEKFLLAIPHFPFHISYANKNFAIFRWAFIWSKNGESWAEGSIFSTHSMSHIWQGGPLHLQAYPLRRNVSGSYCPQWPVTENWNARRRFCDLYEGYGDLCDCTNPSILAVPDSPFNVVKNDNLPTVIVASERPLAIHKCLRRLMSIRGSNSNMTLVVADGNPQQGLKEVEALVSLFGIKVHFLLSYQ
ncbi:hypothetical protein SK128_003829 [Halocaridina rubra]|uniref:Uncharacterized protein n=1 Tax=Halocaridina rubra TaxID=373956 RepID=A0AAN9A4W7_HALRR